jgi:hypothetical protein
MGEDNREAAEERAKLADDWPRYRVALAAQYIRDRELYGKVAANASGALRDDARLVADFLPRTRALLLRSSSFDTYVTGDGLLPGASEVRAAEARVSADAEDSCGLAVG